jgi:transcriptional antiterminator
MEKPYLTMGELASLFGLTTQSLHNSINEERFPVPTYKMGKFRVADKVVVQHYFDSRRAVGLSTLEERNFAFP